MRTYDDPCGVARALDLVGERWALLVVRELLFGPKRFTDLQAGLPGVSRNVLSQRLRELSLSGVVRHAGRVYQLTERGRDLEPVLLALARWGSRTELTTGAPLGVEALMLALKTTFTPDAAFPVRVELRFPMDLFRVEIDGAELAVARGEAVRPDVILEAGVDTLRGLIFGGALLPDEVLVAGDREVAERFLRLFPRPTVRS